MSIDLKPLTFPKWLAALLGLAVLTILLGGIAFLRTQASQAQCEAEEQLTAIAQLKTQLLANWRAERLADADSFAGSPFFVTTIADWLAAPQPQTTASIISRFQALQRLQEYSDIVLVDGARQPRLSLSGALSPLDADELAALPPAWQQAQPIFCDLHRTPAGAIMLEVIAPLIHQRDARMVGAVLMKIDPQQRLYPLLQTWPVPSASAKALLVRRDGESVT